MIETERLVLRPVKISDAPYVQALLLSEGFLKFIGKRPVDTIPDTEDYIKEKMITHYDEHGYGNYAMIRKSDGDFVGTAGLFLRPHYDGVDVGYALLPQYYRKGYTYEAAHALVRYADDVLNLPYVNAFTTYENTGSIKIIEKLGMQLIKEIKWEEDKNLSPMYRIEFDKK